MVHGNSPKEQDRLASSTIKRGLPKMAEYVVDNEEVVTVAVVTDRGCFEKQMYAGMARRLLLHATKDHVAVRAPFSGVDHYSFDFMIDVGMNILAAFVKDTDNRVKDDEMVVCIQYARHFIRKKLPAIVAREVLHQVTVSESTAVFQPYYGKQGDCQDFPFRFELGYKLHAIYSEDPGGEFRGGKQCMVAKTRVFTVGELERINAYIRIAIAHGGRLVCGDTRRSNGTGIETVLVTVEVPEAHFVRFEMICGEDTALGVLFV